MGSLSIRGKPTPGLRFLRGFLFPRFPIGLLGLSLALALGQRVDAHTASTAFLQIGISNHVMIGQLALAFRDLDSRLGLDADDDGKLSWGEVRRREGDILALVQQGLLWESTTDSQPLKFGALEVDVRQGEGYAVLPFASAGGTGEDFGQLHYRIFFDQDPLHRCLVAIHPRAGISETRAARLRNPIHGILSPGCRAGWIGPDPTARRRLADRARL